MIIKIQRNQEWGEPAEMFLIRKYKNTKRTIVYLREGESFGIEFKDNKCLDFGHRLIRIFEYDVFTKLWDWKEIERGK